MSDSDTKDAPDALAAPSGQAQGDSKAESPAAIEKEAMRSGQPLAMREVSRDTYEAMAMGWLDGTCHSKSAIARKFGVAWDTAQKAVDRGWPQRGWASLKQREAMAKDIERKAAVEAKTREMQSFRDAMREHTGILRSTLAMSARLVRGLYEVADGARWVKSRRRPKFDASGNQVGWEEYEQALTGPELAESSRRLAVALRDISSTLLLWHEKDHEVFAGAGEGRDARGLWNLTPEQFKHIEDTKGDLPPGVTLDMILGPSPRAN